MQEFKAPATGGGSTPSGIPDDCKPLSYENTWDPKLVIPAAENITASSKRGLSELKIQPTQRGKLVIVGSAPSVVNYIDQIREFKADKANKIFCVNNAHALIQEHGIAPDGGLIFEIEKRAYDCLGKPHPDCTYYVCSFCDPYAFDQLEKHKAKVIVWHCFSNLWPHRKALIEGYGKFPTGPNGPAEDPMMVGGGFTTFLRTLTVGYILGFRDYELFGFDSSFHEDARTHFFGKPNYGGMIVDCYAATVPKSPEHPEGLKKYRSMAYLIRQADEFRQFCENYHKDFKMRVWGPGLLPDTHRFMYPQMYGDE